MNLFKIVGDVTENLIKSQIPKVVSESIGFPAFKDENKKSLSSFFANNLKFTIVLLTLASVVFIVLITKNPNSAVKIAMKFLELATKLAEN